MLVCLCVCPSERSVASNLHVSIFFFLKFSTMILFRNQKKPGRKILFYPKIEKSKGTSWFFAFRETSKASFMLILLFLMWVVRHCQSTQNSKFAISWQYFKKEVRDKFHFLYEDKHQMFLQVNTIVFIDHDIACSKYPK